MLTRIYIHGFKSFHHFEMEFAPFTVIAGANGSGKSNLFDALTLLARMADGSLKDAFKGLRGDPSELFTQYHDGQSSDVMEFEVDLLVSKEGRDVWGGAFLIGRTRLRYSLAIKRQPTITGKDDYFVSEESLVVIPSDEDQWINRIPLQNRSSWFSGSSILNNHTNHVISELLKMGPDDGVLRTIHAEEMFMKKTFQSPGSMIGRTFLSRFDAVEFPHIFAAREEIKRWRFLQMNPEDLGKASSIKDSDDEMSRTGANLAGVLNRIKHQDPHNLIVISRKLNRFLPSYIEVDVREDQENNQLVLIVKDVDGKTYSARVLSEGTLRILALCILEQDDQYTGLLCLEEPENGIHPFRIPALTALLKDLSVDFVNPDSPLRQVLVNTHSPAMMAEAVNFNDPRYVGAYYARMQSLVTSVSGKDGNEERTKLLITRMIPIINDQHGQTPYNNLFSQSDLRITISDAKKYLQNEEAEKAREILDQA